jgi:hypothetical protein
MVQTIAATSIGLRDLRTKFDLQLVKDQQFFREWLDDLPDLSDFEEQLLNRVRQNFFNIYEYPPILESTVKMVALSPLLDLAGFYLPPFHIETEPSINLELNDDEVVVRGRIDVLVLQEQLWVLVIESKRSGISLSEGLPQMLTYLLSNPDKQKPSFGLLTNGIDFQFLKLTQFDAPQYAFSRLFNLYNPGNDLYDVLKVMKHLAQLLKADII